MAMLPLQLEELVFDTVRLETNSEHDPENGTVSRVEFDVQFGRTAEDAGLWRVELTVEVCEEEDRPSPPYDLLVCGVGFFRVDPECRPELVPKLVAAEGTATIYASIRELVLTLSGRGPWGSYLLPSVSLGDLEPQRQDESPQVGGELVEVLAEYGPLSLRDLAALLDIHADELRPLVKALVDTGILIRRGRGRGTRYQLVETLDDSEIEVQ